jgi:hypothetical protein
MMKEKFFLPLILFSCLAGCLPAAFIAGSAAGIGGYKFYHGKLTVLYEAPYMETWDAALKALEAMSIQIRSQKHDLTAGQIEAKRSDRKNVYVDVKYKSAKETEVGIRVGFFGDESASMAIKEEIRKILFKE